MNRYGSFRSAFHFVGIAGIGWLIDNLVFFLIVAVAHGSAFFANFAGGLCGATVTFIGARERLFETRRGRTWVRLSGYLVYTLLLLTAASAAVQWLAIMMQSLSPELPVKWAAMLAKLAVTPFTLMLNYLMARFLSTR
jgi:putative flippase GtrA